MGKGLWSTWSSFTISCSLVQLGVDENMERAVRRGLGSLVEPKAFEEQKVVRRARTMAMTIT